MSYEKNILIDCYNFQEVEKYNVSIDSIKTTMKDCVTKIFDNEKILWNNMEISLTFTSLEEIQEINNQYRDKNEPTDVLSFPQYESVDEIKEIAMEEKEIFLGDVVICLEKVKNQSEEFEHSFARELIYLFTHSILHLLEYDHMEDDEKKIMRSKEEAIMVEL